jgi:hypothetical protein
LRCVQRAPWIQHQQRASIEAICARLPWFVDFSRELECPGEFAYRATVGVEALRALFDQKARVRERPNGPAPTRRALEDGDLSTICGAAKRGGQPAQTASDQGGA